MLPGQHGDGRCCCSLSLMESRVPTAWEGSVLNPAPPWLQQPERSRAHA